MTEIPRRRMTSYYVRSCKVCGKEFRLSSIGDNTTVCYFCKTNGEFEVTKAKLNFLVDAVTVSITPRYGSNENVIDTIRVKATNGKVYDFTAYQGAEPYIEWEEVKQ